MKPLLKIMDAKDGYPIRIPQELVERAAKLLPLWLAKHGFAGGRIGLANLFKHAVMLGLDALEAELLPKQIQTQAPWPGEEGK
jgi:hypothetical protein